MEFCLSLLLSLFCIVVSGYVSFDELYADGVAAYDAEDWQTAVSSLETAIESYKQYKSGLSDCSIKCRNTSLGNQLIDQSSVGRIALKASCLKECLNDEFGSFTHIAGILPDVKKDFETLIPYQYLQYAYFKQGMLAHSVAAAYTYSLRFPEDEMMKENMEFYRSSADVSEEMFVNMESIPHLEKYNQAVQAYLKENYIKAAELFEEALREYYKAVDVCHGFCEGEEASQEEQWELDFYKQNAYHYIHVLECSLKCVQDLSSEIQGQVYPQYLPLHYHYLQFAYYQVEDFKNAAECAKSYLVFHPDHSVMKENLKSISNDIDVNNIEARPEAQQHNRSLTLEAAMLKFSYQNFGIKDGDMSLLKPFEVEVSKTEMAQNEETREQADEIDIKVDAEQQHSDEDESVSKSKDTPYESMKEKTDDIINKKAIDVERKLAEAEKTARDELQYAEPDDDIDVSDLISENRPGYRVVDSKYVVSLNDKANEDPIAEGPILFEDTILVANSTQLKGRERFAVDGLADHKQCLDLIDLELSFGKPGDGYNGQESPHTEHERFEGVTLLRAANMAKQGMLPLSTAVLYYELSEKARAQVQAYFKLSHLYFDYTHLVCRTAKSKSPTDRNDLSHPVHADNCLLKSTGDCVKESPAYTWRDYSAILYLNDDFEGGEFLFADSTARRVRTLVKPKCGRMVSFGAGAESFHGVKPVVDGRRCAVALWFTLSEERDEKNRSEAKRILDELLLKQKDEL